MTDATTAAAEPPPRPSTVEEVADDFRRRASLVAEAAPTAYRDGMSRAWKILIEIADNHNARTRVTELQALQRLTDHIVGASGRVKGPSAAPSPAALPEVRKGREDAYTAAVKVCERAIDSAGRLLAEEEARLLARERMPWEDELSDWNGYPLVPMPGDMAIADLAELALFLGGDGTSFTGDLLRLIGKADPKNLQQLSTAFPRHVRAYLLWRACAPVPVRTFVALLNTTTMISERKL